MTRRILFASASALALLLAGTAGVQAASSQSTTFTVNGTVDNACTLGTWTYSGPGSFDTPSSTVTVDLDGNDDAVLDPPADSVLTADAMCNYTATNGVKLEGGSNDGLDANASSVPGGFADHVDYTATLAWAGIDASPAQISYTTDGDGIANSAQANLKPANAQAQLTISNFTQSDLLLAGTYTDTVTVTIGTAP